ncbi:PspA/IM30 family protein [Fredinandcohnia onubensis]|uniref:PspA/IM30 family protein n=1 Tax=Fredinandcohnia onubensis TaxID=1571209 RepID=UPI000C0BD9D5|nr:PspA/IM30 family protein [Fredinandcohnia onubensis]
MANLLTRIKDTILADFHGVLDEKEKKNPIALLNQYLRQCEAEVEKVRKLVERQHSLKDQFAREHREAEDLAEKRKHQAGVAHKAGETELYEFAVQEQVSYEERAAKLQEALKNTATELIGLEKKYEEMKHKLKDMHIKRMELMGRENIARANHRMNQVLDTNAYTNKASRTFEEMESYLDRLEHQVNSSYHRNTIDARIALLEKEVKNEETHSIS